MGKKKDKQRKITIKNFKMTQQLQDNMPKAAEELLITAGETLRRLHKVLRDQGHKDGKIGVLLVLKPEEGPAVLMANEAHERMMREAANGLGLEESFKTPNIYH